MQLRYLKEIVLKKSVKTKQPNGTYINSYNDLGAYKVQIREINDEASVSIYGATINKMYRISSVRKVLENLLQPKINDTQDNISTYYIEYDNSLFKISAVKSNWLDIEYVESK